MQALLKLTLVELKLYVREPAALIFALAFPALLLIVQGEIFGNRPDPEFFGIPSIGYVDAIVPAISWILIGTMAFMTIPGATAAAREKKILRRYRATPLRPAYYFAANLIIYLSLAVVGMVIVVVLAQAFYGLRFRGSGPAVFLGYMYSGLGFCAIGYLVASLAPTARVAQAAGQVLFFPMLFLSGATFPREVMPETIRQISDLLPATHMVAFVRRLWFGDSWLDYPGEMAMIAAMLVVGTVVSARTFRWE